MSLPYYPMYPRDFYEGTQRMTLELKGAYIMLLNLIYTRNGPVDDEDGYLARYVGCSIRKWQKLRLELIGHGKIIVENGMIRNSRADEELLKRASYQDQQRENRSRPNKNSDLESPSKTTRAKPEPEPDITSSSSCSDGLDVDDPKPEATPPAAPPARQPVSAEVMALPIWQRDPWSKAIFAAAGPGLADPDKDYRVWLDLSARLSRWKLAGWDLDADVLPVIVAKTDKVRSGGPMWTFKFLEDDIGLFRAKRLQDAPKPVEIIDAEPASRVVYEHRRAVGGRAGNPGFSELLGAEISGGEALRDARAG